MFAEHRKRFASRIASGIAILPAAPETIRNGDVHHEYRQDSDFYYLTGFEEPGAVALLCPDQPKDRFVLFVRPRDKAAETWNGRRAGVKDAHNKFGADASFPVDDIGKILPRYLAGAQKVYAPWGRYESFDRDLAGWLQKAKTRQTQFERSDVLPVLSEMRSVKDPQEIARMRRAAEVTRAAHVAAMRATRPGVCESEIEGVLRYQFRAGGAQRSAYPPIVGSGVNATILHYTQNHCDLGDGDLLLIDAGAEFDYYACDVTRTFPVNGKFTPTQRAVYEMVLCAQRAAIEACRPGVSYLKSHEVAVRILTEGMVRLGILKGRPRDLIRSKAYRKFYMHGTGHWLGMDVHDVGRYQDGKKPRLLTPGRVMTVEPGIYIPDRTRGVDRSFWGIGIRIEDDVVVTRGAPEVLTEGIPKEIDQIESIVGTADRHAAFAAASA